MKTKFFIKKKFNPVTSETVIHAIPFQYGTYSAKISLHYHVEGSSVILSVDHEYSEVKVILGNRAVNTERVKFSETQLDENGYEEKLFRNYFKIDSTSFKEICESETTELWLYKSFGDGVFKLDSSKCKNWNFIPYFRAFFNLTFDSSKYEDAIDELKRKEEFHCATKRFLFW